MAKFIPSQSGIDFTIRGPGGPVSKFMRDYARDVERRAKIYASHLEGRGRASTGQLVRSIEVRTDVGPSGISLVIGARAFRGDVNYAMSLHQGHKAIPVGPKGYTRFQVDGGTRWVTTRKPIRAVGGYPFLTRALKDANDALPLSRQFRIIIIQKGRNEAPPRGLPRL